MYGGFDDAPCQQCPVNSVNQGGYSMASCECEISQSSCIGKVYIVATMLIYRVNARFIHTVSICIYLKLNCTHDPQYMFCISTQLHT